VLHDVFRAAPERLDGVSRIHRVDSGFLIAMF
jgi:hypothetical protein